MNTSIYKGEIIMTLKRITACILCLILAMALTAPAVAQDVEIDVENPVSQSVTVSYEEAETFSFSILPGITLSKNAATGVLSGSSPVSLSAKIGPNSVLNVRIQGDFGEYSSKGKHWRLTGPNGCVLYQLTARDANNPTSFRTLNSGDVFLTYNSSNTGAVTQNLEFESVEGTSVVPGATYQGTLTFVISKVQ